jgi:diguanylate cyclase (GGDEF)-like protein/PAS domain S-box-containing protein
MSNSDYRLLVENQVDLMAKFDLEGRLLFVSPSFYRAFGKREDELLGESIMPLVHEADRPKVADAIAELDLPPHHCYVEQRMRTVAGWRWLSWSHTAVLDPDGRVGAVVCVGRDVTERKVAELKLEYLVDHDELTGLLNRRGIWQAIQRVHALSIRSGRPYGVAVLDLDHFKRINDAHGHVVGDEVLRRIAETLRLGVREADWLGRWGGEELVILMPDIDEARARAGLERLRESVAERSIEWQGRRIRVTMSIGFATIGPAEDNPGSVLTRADLALYQAKSSGRNRVCYDDHDSGGQAVSMAILVQDAIQTARVLPAFQPIVDLRSRRVVAEEALARIVGLDGRILSAAGFIDIAQQLGLLHRIDTMLFCATARRLASADLGGDPPSLDFVHLSGDLLRHPEALTKLVHELDSRIRASRGASPLVLTISERQITAGTKDVARALAPLLDAGCRLAVSDFGGESSSFRFMTHLPVDFLEVDASLVRLASDSARARSVLSTIQCGARDLGITTIAKQIEDDDTRQRLMDLGIDWGAGYLFGRPSEPVRDKPKVHGDQIGRCQQPRKALADVAKPVAISKAQRRQLRAAGR